MSVYLVPLTLQSQQIAGQTFTVNGPKYLSTDLLGLPLFVIPYESIGIVSLAAPNASLAGEPDVYSFPSNLSTLMASADVATLSTFLAAANVPTGQIVSGISFDAALQIIAKIFLVAQALRGISGAPIFSQGITLATAVEDSDLAPLATTPIPSTFDFSDVKPSDTIEAVLDSVSKQFVGSVNLGGVS